MRLTLALSLGEIISELKSIITLIFDFKVERENKLRVARKRPRRYKEEKASMKVIWERQKVKKKMLSRFPAPQDELLSNVNRRSLFDFV